MLYRSLPDLAPSTDADLDTDAMAAAEERGERHLRILARLAEIGMNLAEALGRQAQARIETAPNPAGNEDGAPTPGVDLTAAFDKIAQTVRRTVALEDRLAAGLKTRRDGLIALRAARRADLDAAHESGKTTAILYGLHDAYAAATPEAEYQERIENLMEDTQEYLGDADEMRGYLDRPVGETVARLCATMGLDPDSCVLDGDTWNVRRPPTEFEQTCQELRNKSAILPPTCGEGQIAERSEWGTAGKPPDFEAAAVPHSGCSASCPSP